MLESCGKLGLLRLDIDDNNVSKGDSFDNYSVTKETVVKKFTDMFHDLGT